MGVGGYLQMRNGQGLRQKLVMEGGGWRYNSSNSSRRWENVGSSRQTAAAAAEALRAVVVKRCFRR
jgi:hypothetical protein